ncbi:hypothetical protein V6N13_021967 [Hibiscus sabdariffa]
MAGSFKLWQLTLGVLKFVSRNQRRPSSLLSDLLAHAVGLYGVGVTKVLGLVDFLPLCFVGCWSLARVSVHLLVPQPSVSHLL